MKHGDHRFGSRRALVFAVWALVAHGALVSVPASAAPAERQPSSASRTAKAKQRSMAGRAAAKAKAKAKARKRSRVSRAALAAAPGPEEPTPGAVAAATSNPTATGTNPAATGTRLDVEVIEVAGGRAYLAPGAKQHVRVGNRVWLGGRRYPVLAVNAKTLVVAADGQIARGQRGQVTVQVGEALTFEQRAVPRALAAFSGRWRSPVLPAESQTPRFVPLGVMSDQRRNRAAFSVDYQRIQPLSGPSFGIGRTRLRALLHAELSSVPLRLDADAQAEFWQAGDLELRPANASRPFISVRQLELGYFGEVFKGSIGRLRHASRTLGSLDGARVSASLTDAWSVAAFGGTLADPLDGSVSADASRFGAELAWQDVEASWQPRGSLTLQGSRFLGRTDERRATGLFEAFPAFGRLGARAEVSLFDTDNPWAAATKELTAAGADASFRFDHLRVGASFDMRRPERSLWLASFLPRGYFCVAEPAPAAAIEPCVGGEQRYAAAFNAAWEATLWTADAGTTFATTRRTNADQTTAFVNLRRRELVGKLRVDAGGSLSRGSFYDSAAINIAPGTPLWNESADVSFYYRPSWMRYRAELDGSIEHGFGTRLWWAASPVFDLSGSADVLVGRDVDVLVFQLSAAYRPRF
jgi:hypothetical protein